MIQVGHPDIHRSTLRSGRLSKSSVEVLSGLGDFLVVETFHPFAVHDESLLEYLMSSLLTPSQASGSDIGVLIWRGGCAVNMELCTGIFVYDLGGVDADGEGEVFMVVERLWKATILIVVDRLRKISLQNTADHL